MHVQLQNKTKRKVTKSYSKTSEESYSRRITGKVAKRVTRKVRNSKSTLTLLSTYLNVPQNVPKRVTRKVTVKVSFQDLGHDDRQQSHVHLQHDSVIKQAPKQSHVPLSPDAHHDTFVQQNNNMNSLQHMSVMQVRCCSRS